MKKIIELSFFVLLSFWGISQNKIRQVESNYSTYVNINSSNKLIPTHFIPTPDIAQIMAEDIVRDEKGMAYRIGVTSHVNITNVNSGLWSLLPNGDKIWQLAINNPGAEALSFIFNDFILSEGATFWVENKNGEKVSKVLDSQDQLEDFQQHIALCYGDDLILNLYEKVNIVPSSFTLNRVIYNYRSTGNKNKQNGSQKINESDPCQVNVNCTEGSLYQDEKRGIARIYVVNSGGAFVCSGSLVNNTSHNCKPLFLTALHCSPSSETTAADMLLWKFYFRYEAPSCANPSSVGTLANNFITSCIRLADSNDNNGTIERDDFLLVQLGTLSNESTTINLLKTTNFNAYWNGWDANNIAANKGVGIHHPSGDIKKISTFSVPVTSSSYSGTTSDTHWKTYWIATTTNWGVTEGGSSGSPLFVENGGNSRVVGTLSGGPSSCAANSSSKYDLYGKMSYHWSSNGTSSALSLKYHLDPANTGLLVLDGSSNPCSSDLFASVSISSNDLNNNICSGTSVTFTASPTNGGSNPTYQWKINGSNVGSNSAIYTTNSLTNGQVVTCVMNSSLSGVLSSPATSNSITMTVISLPNTPSINQNGSTLTSSSATGNQWYLNGNIIPGATSQTYHVNQTGNYSVVIKGNGCSSSPSPLINVDVTAINEENMQISNFEVYPNPNFGQFTFLFTSIETMDYTIKLFDNKGNILEEKTLENFNGSYTQEFDLTKKSKGEYFLRVTNSKNQKVEKIIIH